MDIPNMLEKECLHQDKNHTGKSSKEVPSVRILWFYDNGIHFTMYQHSFLAVKSLLLLINLRNFISMEIPIQREKEREIDIKAKSKTAQTVSVFQW